MRIEVLFFAQLKDHWGQDGLIVDVPEGVSVGELRRTLFEKNARMDPSLPLRYAVNEEFREEDFVLKDRDVVAILPPVSGG